MGLGLNNLLRRNYYKDYKDYPRLFKEFIFGYREPGLSDIILFTCNNLHVESQTLDIEYEVLISDLYLYYLQAENKVGKHAIHYLLKVLQTKAITLSEKWIKKHTIRMADITEAVEEAISHQSYTDIRHKEMEQAGREDKMQEVHFKLTETELNVLQYLVEGLSYYEICDRLDMKPSTFKTMKSNIKRKLDPVNREEELGQE